MRTAMATAGAALLLLSLGGCKSRVGGGEPSSCEAPVARQDCQPAPRTECEPAPKAECEPAPNLPVVGRVRPGDTLQGRLTGDQGCQCFYFEGVEYSLLDYCLSADEGCQSAPTLRIEDPDGKPLEGDTCLSRGSGSQATGIVLHKTGVYRGLVCKAPCDPEVFYRFTYDLRHVAPFDQSLTLTPCSRQVVSFSASRGSNVIVTISPTSRHGVTPKVVGVKDPDGGRALAPESRLEGACEPTITDQPDGGIKLQFNAPKAGNYRVMVTSEPDTAGEAVAHVQVFPPKSPNRTLYHDGHPCPEGYTVPTAPSEVATSYRR